jgi:choline dehydrogenase-like flavoprotein
MGFVGKLKAKPQFADAVQRMAYCDRGNYAFRTAVRIKSDCGKYTACVFFRPALTLQNRLEIYKYKSLLGAGRGMQRVRAAMSSKLFHPDILAEIFAHLTGMQVKSGIFNILVLFEQKRAASRVRYDEKNILVDWYIDEQELSLYNLMLHKLRRMIEPIAKEMVLQIPLTEDWLWSAAHHSGTIAMGSPPSGLVDASLKLHGFDNVHVCDGSVIQEHSYANTGLTIGQMAMFVAQQLQRN